MIDDIDDGTPTPPDVNDANDSGQAEDDQGDGDDASAENRHDTHAAGGLTFGRYYPMPGDDLMGWPHPSVGTRDVGFGSSSQTSQHFDPARDGGSDVVGTPAKDMAHWHEQKFVDSCCISCEEYVLNALGERSYSENDLVRESMAHGWYGEHGTGTAQLHIGSLLKEHGIPVRQEFGRTLADMTARLEQGEKVIVGIQSQAMTAGSDGHVSLSEYGGIPSQFVGHAVEVIGIKGAHTSHPVVILNDPGRPDGAGLMVPADVFERGWAPSGHFMVSTAIHDTPEHKGHDPVRFGGYYDENATHHRAPAEAPRFGSWEQSAYSGTWYEYDPTGTYTGNWSR